MTQVQSPIRGQVRSPIRGQMTLAGSSGDSFHDGISFDAATGRVVLKAVGAAPTITTLAGAFTFTGGNQSMYMGPAGLLVPSVTNTPRIEYDAGGNCLGLLMEASRTNLCLQSQTFGTTWAVAAASISSNTTTAPDGTSTADTLVENSATAQHLTNQIGITSLVAATVYTASVFVKAAGRTRGRLIFVDSTQTDGVLVNFNLGTGVVTGAAALGAGTVTASGIQQCSDGWYRVWVSGAMNNAKTTGGPYVNLQDGAGANSYLGDGASGLYVWGGQLEVGAFPSSYIPTTTGSVARTADSCVRTLGSEFSATAGTIVLAGRTSGGQDAGLGQTIIEIDDATSNERHTITRAATSDTVRYNIFDGGVLQSSMESASLSNLSTFKSAFAWALNDIAQSTNGGTVNTDTGATLPTVTQLVLGGPGGNGNSFMNGHIRDFDYYPTRLPNNVLQQRAA